MATESPIRIIETGGKWPSHNDAVRFGPSSANIAIEDLGLLLKGHRFQGSGGRDLVPNRSGSAPPNMEGSFAAIENLVSQQYFTSNPSLESLNINATIGGSYVSEEQLRADPAYVAYYWSNVNLNPRLPPPLMSWENRGLVRHSHSSSGNNGVRLTSFDDSSTNDSLLLPLGNLPTHKEESEDDRSPQPVPDDWAERSGGFWSGADEAASPAQLKSLVDLIQEDFPRTPSPLYNQVRSLSHESAEEAVTYDADSGSLHDPPIGTSNAITSSTSGADDIGQSSYSESSTAPISSSPSLDGTVDVRGVESGKNSISISRNRSSESHMKKQDRHHIHQSSAMLQEHVNRQPSTTFQVQGGVHPQMISQVVSHNTYIGTNQFLHGPSTSFSAAEVQPVLQSSYGSASAYMTSANPFHSNLQPSGYFSPQYNVGGYAFNSTALSPYGAAGYLPHSAVPLPFDPTATSTFSAQTSGPSTPGVDMQYLNRFYSQLGYPMQPPFADPLQLQYFQAPPPPPSFGDTQQKGSELAAAYSAEQKFHTNVNPRGVGVTSSPFFVGSPTNVGVFHQFPTSPIAASPQLLPGSPVGGRGEVRLLSPGSARTAGMYNEWQGQRGGLVSFDDSKTYSFLDELKSGKGRRFELSDIAGHIVEFSADQHGSRFIQQKLEICSHEEKQSVFKEVLPHASELMIDVFGNYVIQKFFEYGSPEQRKELANQLEGHILPLSLQMYGCRVIQKALEVIELEQKCELVHELDGNVLRCVRDQNGNHVIQKCIESIPTQKIDFIISSFRDQVAILSTHPYGCRVIQRVLERCTDELQSQFIVDEILESVCSLSQDQYGNYVTQHVLERGKAHERNQIISKLSGRFVQLSQHKFASNVVEKCLEYGDSSTREILIGEIVGDGDGQDNLLTMVKDQYANYVVQKILQTCTGSEREMLLSRIRIHLNSLKKYTYGKHIVARFEQLYGEELQTQQQEDHR